MVGGGGKTSLMFCLARLLSADGGTVLTTTTTKIFVPPPETSPCVLIAPTAADLLDQAENLPSDIPYLTAGREILEPANKLAGYTPMDIETLYRSRRFKWIVVEADGAARRPLKAPADHEPVIPDCTNWLIAVAGLDAIGHQLSDETVFRSVIYSQVTGKALGETVDAASVSTILTHPRGLMKGGPISAQRWVFLNKADTDERMEQGRQVAACLLREPGANIHEIFIGCAKPELVIYYKSNVPPRNALR